jgi:hypothetical protein
MSATTPRVDFCLVCDDIRQEAGRKITVLGLYGLLPHVEITLQKWGGVIEKLTFLLSLHGSAGDFTVQAQILDPDGDTLIGSGPIQSKLPSDAVSIGFAFAFPMLAFKKQGKHQLVVLVNGHEIYRNPFVVKEGPVYS